MFTEIAATFVIGMARKVDGNALKYRRSDVPGIVENVAPVFSQCCSRFGRVMCFDFVSKTSLTSQRETPGSL